MKRSKLIIGTIFLFSTIFFNTYPVFAQDYWQSRSGAEMPQLSPFKMSTPDILPLPLRIGNIPIVPGENVSVVNQGNIYTLSSTGENKILLSVGGDKIIALTHNPLSGSTTIEYQGTTITIDSRVEIGKIEVGEDGVKIYDKDGNLIGGITKEGTSYWKIKDSFVTFEKGVNLTVKGDDEGKTNYIEAETDAGKYTIKVDGNQIKITSPSQDSITIDTDKFQLKISISKNGEASVSFYTIKDRKDRDIPFDAIPFDSTTINFNSEGRINSVRINSLKSVKIGKEIEIIVERYEISLDRQEGVTLNLTANADGSVTIKSNIENSVSLKFKKDGTIEVIKPDGTTVSLEGDIEKATFNKDGSLTITCKNGAVVTIDAQGNATIEYQGTTLKIGANLLGKIDINKNGYIYLYDKAGNYLAFISSEGWGRIWIAKGIYNCVEFGGGTTVEITGEQGGIKSIKVTTDAGSYLVERTADGKIKVTTPGGDAFSYNFSSEFAGGHLSFNKDGSALLDVWTKNFDRTIRVSCDNTGKITTVSNYVLYPDRKEISIERTEGVSLNLTANADGSVTIKSNIENSVSLKFKKDGTIEVIKPDGTTVSIAGDIEKATFNKDGSLTINFKNGTTITIKPDTAPPSSWQVGSRVYIDAYGQWGTVVGNFGDDSVIIIKLDNGKLAVRKYDKNTKSVHSWNCYDDWKTLATYELDRITAWFKNGHISKEEYTKAINFIMGKLSPEEAAGVLSELTPGVAAEILSLMTPQKAAEILGQMDSQKAAKILDAICCPGGEFTRDGLAKAIAIFLADGLTPQKAAEILTAWVNLPNASGRAYSIVENMVIAGQIKKAAGILVNLDAQLAAQWLSAIVHYQDQYPNFGYPNNHAAADLVLEIYKQGGAEKAAEILSLMDASKAAEILGQMSDKTKAKDILLKIETSKAVKIIEAMDPQKAAEILETTHTSGAFFGNKEWQALISIFKSLNSQKAGEILNHMSERKARCVIFFVGSLSKEISLLEAMDPAKAAKVMGNTTYSENLLKNWVTKIFEGMNPDKAAAILSKMLDTPTKASDILSLMDASKAASILNSDNLDVNTCVDILKKMDRGKVGDILVKLDQLNPTKASKIREGLTSENWNVGGRVKIGDQWGTVAWNAWSTAIVLLDDGKIYIKGCNESTGKYFEKTYNNWQEAAKDIANWKNQGYFSQTQYEKIVFFVFGKLSPEEAAGVLSGLAPEVAAEILSVTDPQKAAEILGQMDSQKAAEILDQDEISVEKAADILEKIGDRRKVLKIILGMGVEKAIGIIEELLRRGYWG